MSPLKKENKEMKFTAEDMIMIDDEDDIIEAWTSDDEQQEVAHNQAKAVSANKSDLVDKHQTKKVKIRIFPNNQYQF